MRAATRRPRRATVVEVLLTCTVRRQPYVLLVERGDGYGWNLPGGPIGDGEYPAAAAARILHEETGRDDVVPARRWHTGDPRPAHREACTAQQVPVLVRAALYPGRGLPEVGEPGNGCRAVWRPAESFPDLVGTALAAQFHGRPAWMDLLGLDDVPDLTITEGAHPVGVSIRPGKGVRPASAGVLRPAQSWGGQ